MSYEYGTRQRPLLPATQNGFVLPYEHTSQVSPDETAVSGCYIDSALPDIDHVPMWMAFDDYKLELSSLTRENFFRVPDHSSAQINGVNLKGDTVAPAHAPTSDSFHQSPNRITWQASASVPDVNSSSDQSSERTGPTLIKVAAIKARREVRNIEIGSLPF